MSDVVIHQIDALEATLAVAGAQLAALRHALQTPATPVKPVAPALPERCAGIPSERCALRSDEAKHVAATFADPYAWRCDGCGYWPDQGM